LAESPKKRMYRAERSIKLLGAIVMITRRASMLGVVAAGLFAVAATEAKERQGNALAALDTDHDGTVDLAEAKAAAGTAFDKLDTDHDGTVDRKELRGRLSAKQLAAGDPDKDRTLSKDEYLAIVEQHFKAADADNDGTLTAKELRGRAGRALLRLLQ
jgi:Ca2+-binding EF-hand superfamily protein